jgi:hypothetical protein
MSDPTPLQVLQQANGKPELAALFLTAMEWGRDHWTSFSMRGDSQREVAEQFADKALAALPAAAVPTQQPSGLKLYDLYETRDGRRVSLHAKSDDGETFYGRLPDGRVVAWHKDGRTPPDSTRATEYPSDLIYRVGLIPVGASPAPAAAASVQPVAMRDEFNAWVRDRGCDTDGAWSAWQGCWKLFASPIGLEAAASEGVKPGWKLVPVEPTTAMLQAAVKSRHGPATYKVSMATLEEEDAAEDYRAMLAASPSIGSAGGAGATEQADSVHSAAPQASVPVGVHSGLAAPNAPSAEGSDPCASWHDWEQIDSTPTSQLMRCKRCGYEERHFDD